jgi:hypothetical protein
MCGNRLDRLDAIAIYGYDRQIVGIERTAM